MKDERIKAIEALHENSFEILDEEYTSLSQKVRYKCQKCGYIGKQTLARLKYDGHCKNCKQIERRKKLKESQYRFRYDRAKNVCEERGYTFFGVFNKGKTWYVRFEMDIKDREGKGYGIIEQEEYCFLKNIYPKIMASDKVARPQEEFIKKVQKVHPELDFTKTVYINNKTSIKVICPKHGEFTVSPREVIKPEYKCFECKKEELFQEKKLETIRKMKELHGGKYEYDVDTFNYVKNKMRMICPEHGEFWQSPYNHLKGQICQKCARKRYGLNKRLSDKEFKDKVKDVHGDKYDLTQCCYEKSNMNVTVICHEKDKYGREHGEFKVTPHAFLSGQGCPKCSGKHSMNLKEFKETADIVHKGKFDYSQIQEYKGIYLKVPIICHEKDELDREHGLFYQTPKNHLNGFGCKKCSSNYMDLDLFVTRSNRIHGNTYMYDNIMSYTNNTTKVPIECPKHGIFYQAPMSHLNGQGCPYCKESHLERKISIFLDDNNIPYERQKRFDWLVNDKTGYKLPLDFYLPEHNIAIECQGEQHFIANFYKSKGDKYAEEHLEGVQYRDRCKRRLCKQNKVNLIYFTEKRFIEFLNNEVPFFSNPEDLLEYAQEIHTGGI